MDVLSRAQQLVGKRAIITFADNVREDWTIKGVDPANRVISVEGQDSLGPTERTTCADYEIDGTDNRHSGGESVPGIVGIEAF